MRTITIILLLFLTLYLNSQDNETIPVEQLFSNPYKSDFKISPDGKYISYLAEYKNRLNIYLQKVGDSIPTCLTRAKKRDIYEYYWANNSNLIYLMDDAGDENTKLFGIDITNKKIRCYTPFKNVMTFFNDELKQNHDEIIVELNKDSPEQFNPYRLNLVTGELTLLAENQSNILEWFFDNVGQLRIAIQREAVNNIILYRKNDSAAFDTLLTIPFYDHFRPYYFINENTFYALSNRGRDKNALVIFNVETKQEAVIFEHPEFDVDFLSYSYQTQKLNYLTYYSWRGEKEFFNEEYRKINKSLCSKLNGYEILFFDKTYQEDKFIIATYNDRTLGGYYYYDKLSDTLIHLADDMPWLDEKKMAPMKPIQYMSRDSLTIYGYLTLPDHGPDSNIPVVVLVHGGPWARDMWVFDKDVQFLANRGYGVLQINYRGSTGYGKSFYKASFKQWGLAMQDDITDGVEWLIDQGIADSSKIAIWGGSYGGYAALAGIAFTPDLYQCAIDEVGISNLFTYYENYPPHWELYKEQEYIEIGNPKTDSLLLYNISPYFHADKIKVPVFIAQGSNDPRVPKLESEQMVKVLRNNGIEVKYILKDNEGHGFRNEENRIELYKEIELFLNKHLYNKDESVRENNTPPVP